MTANIDPYQFDFYFPTRNIKIRNFRNLLAGMALLLFVNRFSACRKDASLDVAPAAESIQEGRTAV